MQVIHSHVFDPTQSLFKMPANERATRTLISCDKVDCPLLAKKQCQRVGDMFGASCPYGRASSETGPTKRAAGFHSWVRDKSKEYPQRLSRCDPKLVIIGEYVYLPYAHMQLCKSLKFTSAATNSVFLRLDQWTVENVLVLIDFRPQALFGGTIKSYQEKEVPKFLLHLREGDPAMWDAVIAARPQLNEPVNHVGRKAKLTTLVPPVKWATPSKYPVEYLWDGAHVYTTSPNALGYCSEIQVESVEIKIVPKPETTIKVLDNAWVGSHTEFVD